jgi:hypothetical protein
MKKFLVTALVAATMSSCVSTVGLKMDKARELMFSPNAIDNEMYSISVTRPKGIASMGYMYFKNKSDKDIHVIWNDSRLIDKDGVALEVSYEKVDKSNPFTMSRLQMMMEATKKFEGSRPTICFPNTELTESLFFYKSGLETYSTIAGSTLRLVLKTEDGQIIKETIKID